MEESTLKGWSHHILSFAKETPWKWKRRVSKKWTRENFGVGTTMHTWRRENAPFCWFCNEWRIFSLSLIVILLEIDFLTLLDGIHLCIINSRSLFKRTSSSLVEWSRTIIDNLVVHASLWEWVYPLVLSRTLVQVATTTIHLDCFISQVMCHLPFSF